MATVAQPTYPVDAPQAATALDEMEAATHTIGPGAIPSCAHALCAASVRMVPGSRAVFAAE
jgi:hypothetical protein